MLMRHTRDGTQMLKPQNNLWSSKIGGSVLGGKGMWVRITWNSELLSAGPFENLWIG